MKRLFALSILLFACAPKAPQVPEHKIVAKVNNDILSTDQLDDVLADYNGEIFHSDVKSKYVRNWINTSALYQEAIKSGYTLSDKDNFKIEKLKKQLIIRRYIESRSKAVEVLDKDILTYYQTHRDEFKRQENEIRLAHLYLESKELPVSEDLKTNKDILSTIKRLHLDKSKNGLVINGDLGYQKYSDVRPLFLNRIDIRSRKKRHKRTSKKYKDGQIVTIKLKSGVYHYIQVLDRKKAGTYYTIDQVKEIIRERLLVQKMDGHNIQIIEQNKSKYTIINNLTKGL